MTELVIQKVATLKSFLQQTQCKVGTALIALLKLVSREADGKSVPLADRFDISLEENGVSQPFSLYKEKRFTGLGY